MGYKYYFLSFLLFSFLSCSDNEQTSNTTTKYTLTTPKHFPQPIIPEDNQLTVEKILLGRMLFYDPIISIDSTKSCASCHKQQFAFSDNQPLSTQVHGKLTTRNTTGLFNLVFNQTFFWDSRTKSIESTVLDAMVGEQKFDIDNFNKKMTNRKDYQDLFKKVFGKDIATTEEVFKAISSFIRTMVSANTRLDKGLSEGNVEKYLTQEERLGREIFESETGDCFHCHGNTLGNPIFTDNLNHNNGLDSAIDYTSFADIGFGNISKSIYDNGKFKTQTLRNLKFTPPYMHDGRFTTLDQVINHYSVGLKNSPTVDPLMEHIANAGINIKPDQISQLKAFLNTLNDDAFVSDTAFSSPFK